MSDLSDDVGGISVVWRVVGRDSDVVEFVNRYPEIHLSAIFREGERDRRGRLLDESGFNCNLLSDESPSEVSVNLVDGLSRHADALSFVRDRGMLSVVDVGVMFCIEDLVGGLVLAADVLRLLASFEVSLEISVYATSD